MIDRSWASRFRLPPPGNVMERHERREEVFVAQGTRIANALLALVERHAGKPAGACRILDFGCGCGRVALPLYHVLGKPDACVDVDPAVIDYLAREIPGANPLLTRFDPPLPFADDAFDVVLAVAVWTRLDPEYSDLWLTELRRILRPGGLALVTTGNYAMLANRRKDPALGALGWKDVGDERLRREGFVFIQTAPTPGTGPYGTAVHDPGYVLSVWSAYMPVIDIVPGGMEGVQDINVLRKPDA